jgi:serine/threonine protein kinase
MNIIGDDLINENIDDLLGNIEPFDVNNIISGGGKSDDIANERILNIVNFSNDFRQNNHINKQDIIHVSNIIKNNISNVFEVEKMFGIGIHGKLYLLRNKKTGKKYICKRINKNIITPERKKQLEFELDILSYLSSNKGVKKYVTPCLKYYVNSSDIFTIFPMANAIPLTKLKKYLVKLDKKNRIEVVKKLIKNILMAISNIHKLNIAHQNINCSNILISIDKEEEDINVKFTDFGLGCGLYKIPVDDSYNIKNSHYEIKKCKKQSYMETNITKTDLNGLMNSKFLQAARLQDNWNLGLLFLDLIVNDDDENKINIDLNKYLKFDDLFEEQILSKILILLENKNINDDYSEYLREILNGMCGELDTRTSSMYVLDNIIFYEKYEED